VQRARADNTLDVGTPVAYWRLVTAAALNDDAYLIDGTRTENEAHHTSLRVSIERNEDASGVQGRRRHECSYCAIVSRSPQDIRTAPALQISNVSDSPAPSATSLLSRREVPAALFVAGLLELAIGALIGVTLLLCLVDLAQQFFS
jgi:hypothetical protein